MPPQAYKAYEFGSFRLELKDHLLSRNGKPISLTPKAFEVLVCLIERQGHLVKKDELMQEVWGDSFVEEGNVSRTVWMLRNALGDGPNNHKFIKTVPKLGYRFAANVNIIEHEPVAAFDRPETRNQPVETTDELEGSPRIVSDDTEPPEGKSTITATSGNGNGAEATVKHDSLIGTLPSIEPAPAKAFWMRRSLAAALLVAGLAATAIFGVYFWKGSPTTSITSIAVLPFDNLSGNSTQDPFADGLTEALITELGKISVLRVIDRGATSRYKGTQKTISELAQALNVGAIAKGSADRSGDHVRITIQVYRADTGQTIWSESYDRDLGDALVMQSAVAREIAQALKVKLSQREMNMLSDRPSIDPNAQDSFLEGLDRYNTARNISQDDERAEMFRKASESLERAVKIEPNYAAAYAKLAGCYMYMASFNGNPEIWSKVSENAQKALKLDSLNASAHNALAVVAFRFDRDRKTAEREFKTAIDLAPSAGENGLGAYALFLSSDGRQDEALATMKHAMEIDPYSIGMKMNAGNILTRAKKYDVAIEQLKKTAELYPKHAGTRMALSKALAMVGNFDEAILEAKNGAQISGTPADKLKLAWIYARSGNTEQARNILDTVLGSETAIDGTRTAYDAATVYSELGDKDTAFSWLERALAAHAQSILWLKVDPEFEGLRDDPRYEDLVRRLGLSP